MYHRRTTLFCTTVLYWQAPRVVFYKKKGAVGPSPKARVRSLAPAGGQTEELKICLREYRLPQRVINGRNRVPKAAFDQIGRYSLGDLLDHYRSLPNHSILEDSITFFHRTNFRIKVSKIFSHKIFWEYVKLGSGSVYITYLSICNPAKILVKNLQNRVFCQLLTIFWPTSGEFHPISILRPDLESFHQGMSVRPQNERRVTNIFFDSPLLL